MSSTTDHVPDTMEEGRARRRQGWRRRARNGGRNKPDRTGAGSTAKEQRRERCRRKIDALRAELDAAKAQAAEHLDRFLRAKAEADNTRKRTEPETANSRKYAVESFAGEMLTVHDSLDLARSVSLVDSAVAVEKMHEGLELTLKLMNDVLAKFGVTQIDPKGEKFDPARHQALGWWRAPTCPRTTSLR